MENNSQKISRDAAAGNARTPVEIVPVMRGAGYMLVLMSKDGKTCRLFSSKDLDPKEEESCGVWFDQTGLRSMLKTYLATEEGKEYAGRLVIWCVHLEAHEKLSARQSFPVLDLENPKFTAALGSLHPWEAVRMPADIDVRPVTNPAEQK